MNTEELVLAEQELMYNRELQLWRGDKMICAFKAVTNRKIIEKMVESYNYVIAMEKGRKASHE